MKIIDLKLDQESGLIYCNTDKGYYTIEAMFLSDLVAFTLEKKIVESEDMLNYFAAILETMYEENNLLFKFVQHVIKYNFRGEERKISFNVYVDAIDKVRKMRKLGIYENIKTNFKEL